MWRYWRDHEQQNKARKKGNQEMLLDILRAIRYLAHQGLALKGHEESEGHLYQLLLMQSETNRDIMNWLQKTCKIYFTRLSK